MKSIFINFLKNKYFLIWILCFTIVLYFTYNPLLSFKSEYMDEKNITNVIYIYYVFMLPMAFYEMGFASCMVLDLCFLSIVSYIVVNFISYFFVDSISSTLTRIGRKKWIKKVFKINFLFSLMISLFYIFIFIILCFTNSIKIDLEINMFIAIVYKILITLIIPNIYLLLYIKTDSSIMSLGFSSLCYLLLELIIKTTFIEKSLTFNYPIFISMFMIVIYFLVYTLVENSFKRRDV